MGLPYTVTMTKVAVIQMVSSNDLEKNLEQAAELIAYAASQKAEFVLLPEYFPIISDDEQDKVKLREIFGKGPIQEFLIGQSRQHDIWLMGGTIPLESEEAGKVYNSCLLYNPDGIVTARYDKVHLFDVNVDGSGKESYIESNTISSGNSIVTTTTPFATIGMTVCYDLRFPELYREMVDKNVNLVTVPSAFTYTTGKHHWKTLLKARAVENLCFVMAADQGGQNTERRRTWGHSMIISPWGDILASIEEGAGIAIADLDFQAQANLRKSFPALSHRKF
jgi:predicted amidohydrolase